MNKVVAVQPDIPFQKIVFPRAREADVRRLVLEWAARTGATVLDTTPTSVSGTVRYAYPARVTIGGILLWIAIGVVLTIAVAGVLFAIDYHATGAVSAIFGCIFLLTLIGTPVGYVVRQLWYGRQRTVWFDIVEHPNGDGVFITASSEADPVRALMTSLAVALTG